MNQNISSLNNVLNSKLSDLSSNTVKTVSELKTTLSSNINNQTTNLSDQLTNISNNIYSGIGDLNDTLHKDIIGDGLFFATYSVMEIDKNNGNLVGQPAMADYTKINTLAGIIEKAFIKSSVNVYSYTDSDTGNENIVTNYSYTGLVDVLHRLATKDAEHISSWQRPRTVRSFAMYCTNTATSTSADFLTLVVTIIKGLSRPHGISLISFIVYLPNLRIKVTVAFRNCTVFCLLVRLIRLSIRFLFVRPRIRYCFFSPKRHRLKLASR